MDIFLSIENKIKKEFINSAIKAKENGELSFVLLPSFSLDIPKEKEHGDYSINLAIILANIEKKPAKSIGNIFIKYFNKKENYIESIEIRGPGFINIFLNKKYYKSIVEEVLNEKNNYGDSKFGKSEKVNIEFVSANPTGLLHMGNARGATIGDVLSNILKTVGFSVYKEYYVNDTGNQIENFGKSLEARYLELLGKEIEFPEDGYHGLDIIETAKKFITKNGTSLLLVSQEERIEKLIKYGLKEKLKLIKDELINFGVQYDCWFFEKSLYESKEVENSINILKEKGYIEEKENAIWLKNKILGEDKDEVLIRQNGLPTYLASDIAYHKNKFDRGFKYLINIWGADHHGHVSRIKKAISAIGYDSSKLEIILMQLVRVFKDGEHLKMSKRTGTYITLKELLDEVGRDAARYFFIMRNQDSQLDFDLDLAKKTSSDNPVYYIQYAYARISSILRQVDKDINFYLKEECFMYFSDIEKVLIKKVGEFRKVLIESAIKREPYRLANYAYGLSSLFHNFYNICRVLNEENEIKTSRIKLIMSTKYVLKKILKILGISAPEKM